MTAGFLAVSWLCACRAYHPLPPGSAAVSSRLQVPPPAVLALRANKLRHPLLPPITLNPSVGLTPNAAAVLAVLLNPALRAARDEQTLARAQVIQAGLLPNPELSANVEFPTGGDTRNSVTAFGIELDWEATSLITRAAKRQAARFHRDAVKLDVAWREWQTAEAAKGAVYALASLEAQHSVAKQGEQRIDANVSRVKRAVVRGAMTARNLAAAMTTRQTVIETATSLAKQIAEQRIELARLLGLPEAASIRLAANIALPSAFHPPPPAQLLAGLSRRRLDLAALRRGYDSEQARTRAAILGRFPRIRIGPTGGRDIENVDSVGVALTIDLPIFDHNQGKVAIAQATRRRLLDEYATRLFDSRLEVRAIVARIRYLNRQIATAAATAAQQSALVSAYHRALVAGQVDALIYYAAWSDLMTDRVNLLRKKGNLAQAIVALELAVGEYQIPQSPPGPRSAGD